MVHTQAFGWCPHGSECTSSHDTDLIVLQDEKLQGDKKSKRKRKRDKRDKRKGGAAAGAAGGGGGGGGAVEEEEEEEDQDEEMRASKISHMELDSADRPSQDASARDPGARTEPPLVGHAGNGSCALPDDDAAAAATDTAAPAVAEEKKESVSDDDAKAKAAAAAAEASRKRLEGGTHRAGFDAFMTAYIFAHACALDAKEEQNGKKTTTTTTEEEKARVLPACYNKVYLSGKAAPLHIVKSSFSKSSRAHTLKMEQVWGKSLASTLLEAKDGQ